MAYDVGTSVFAKAPYPGATYSLPAVQGGPGGGWNPMPLASPYGAGGYQSGGGQGGGSGDAQLAAQRALVDNRFSQLYGMQQPMADGSDPAFSASARQGLLGQAADAGVGQARSAERMLRQGFRSAMGASGGAIGGGEMQAVMDARRRAAQDTWSRRSGLETTFELENRAARERGIQAMMATLGLEIPWRSRFEVTGSDPLSNAYAQMLSGGQPQAVGGGGPAQGGGGGGGQQQAAAAQEPWDWNKGHPEYGFTGPLQPVGKTVYSGGQGPFAYSDGAAPAGGAGGTATSYGPNGQPVDPWGRIAGFAAPRKPSTGRINITSAGY